MSLKKGHNMIHKSVWQKCQICEIKTKTLYPEMENRNSTRLIRHIEETHSISINDYLDNYHQIKAPLCKCGCGMKSSIRKKSSPVIWRDYPCGKNGGWSIEAKKNRTGTGNPMYNKPAWNKGETKFTNSSMVKIANKMTGKPKSPTHIEKMRNNAINLIKSGRIRKTLTKPHLLVIEILSKLDINYICEFQIGYYLFDIFLPDYQILIEVDGDYWHCNPLIFPNGPKTKTQLINIARDKRKNEYCIENNLRLIRLWEFDILNTPLEIESILCDLKK